SITFGLVWGLWHAPAFLVSGTAQHDLGLGLFWLVMGTVSSSIIMTWLYRRTNGSIFVSGILVHLMINSTAAQLWAYELVLVVPAALAGASLYRSGRKAAA
uniref:CPBP family glutamic-type intramembrane protease n=1 Tax=Salinibacterium sp. TaxID=1915057 RepID=UPI00286CF772